MSEIVIMEYGYWYERKSNWFLDLFRPVRFTFEDGKTVPYPYGPTRPARPTNQ